MDKDIDKKKPQKASLTAGNLRKVLSVNAKINSTLDLDELLGIIMKTAAEVMRTETASLMLLDETGRELIFKVALGETGKQLVEKFRLRVGEGIGGYVAETAEPVIVNDTRNDERFAKRFDHATGFQTRAIICVPLQNNGKTAGIIQAINPLDRDGFDQEDLELFRAFADQAALSVEKARMHEEMLRQEKTRQELKIAHDIQQNFLPHLEQVTLPVDIAATTLPALEVGGDFYDVIALSEYQTAVIIGDVSGKGVPAALYMVRAISEFRYLAPKHPRPQELLKHLNNRLAQNTAFGMFVTLVYVLIDSSRRCLYYSGAGHHPMAVRDNKGGHARFLPDIGGIPAGMTPQPDFEEGRVEIHSGDCFTLYTDGVVEARNARAEEYGSERLLQCLSAPFTSAEKGTRILLENLKHFTAGAPRHDDTTVLMIRV